MNRISQPFRAAGYICVILAIATVFVSLAFSAERNAPIWPVYIFLAFAVIGIALNAAEMLRATNPHVHASIITEVWAERRDAYVIKSDLTVRQMLDGPPCSYVMFTLESGNDTYRLVQTDLACELRAGDFVTIERQRVGSSPWNTTLLRVIPRDEWEKTKGQANSKTR